MRFISTDSRFQSVGQLLSREHLWIMLNKCRVCDFTCAGVKSFKKHIHSAHDGRTSPEIQHKSQQINKKRNVSFIPVVHMSIHPSAIHPLTHWHSSIHRPTHRLILHPSTHPLIHPCTHSPIHSSTDTPTHPSSIHLLPIHPSIRHPHTDASITHPPIHHPSIHPLFLVVALGRVHAIDVRLDDYDDA